MLQQLILRVFASLAALAFGFGAPPAVTAASPPATSHLAAPSDVSAEASEPPRHAHVQMFVNIHGRGESNGCTVTFTPQRSDPGTDIRHGVTCGHPGAVSKVTWKYLKTDRQGDHYQIKRLFPYKEPGETPSVKQVTYVGKELVVWKDEVQRIVMRPPPPKTESKNSALGTAR